MVRWGGVLRPDQFLDHLTVIKTTKICNIMIRIQNTGVFIILLRVFEILETDQDFNHPHQSHLYPGKCRNVRHSHLGKRQKDKKYLNRSRGSQAKWELAAFPHKSPSIADYIIGVHLFTQIWFIKVFFSHTNTIWVNIPLPASKSASDFGNYISYTPLSVKICFLLWKL